MEERLGMNTRSSIYTPTLMVQRFIGTAYDDVKLVADNIDIVTAVANGLGLQHFMLKEDGALTAGLKIPRWYPPGDMTITDLNAWIDDVSVTDVTFEIWKNGAASIGGGTILAGNNEMVTQADVDLDLLATDYLQLKPTTSGGTTLNVRLHY